MISTSESTVREIPATPATPNPGITKTSAMMSNTPTKRAMISQ